MVLGKDYSKFTHKAPHQLYFWHVFNQNVLEPNADAFYYNIAPHNLLHCKACGL